MATKATIKGQTLGQIFSNVDFMVVPICVHPPIVPFFHLDFESITDISTALWTVVKCTLNTSLLSYLKVRGNVKQVMGMIIAYV